MMKVIFKIQIAKYPKLRVLKNNSDSVKIADLRELIKASSQPLLMQLMTPLYSKHFLCSHSKQCN